MKINVTKSAQYVEIILWGIYKKLSQIRLYSLCPLTSSFPLKGDDSHMVGSSFIDVAQRLWLGFRRNYPLGGTFTDLNQLMSPRSQYISRSVTFSLPDRSPLGANSLTRWGTESKPWQSKSEYVRNDTYYPDFIQELLGNYIKDNSNG